MVLIQPARIVLPLKEGKGECELLISFLVGYLRFFKTGDVLTSCYTFRKVVDDEDNDSEEDSKRTKMVTVKLLLWYFDYNCSPCSVKSLS